MLALRRATVLSPALVRHCQGAAFITKMKAMEAETAKLAATLPDDLKGMALAGGEITANLTKFASERPELYKTVIAKIAEADKPKIVATVSEAKDPKACKYTEEGTLLHEMMQRVYKSDRRMAALAERDSTRGDFTWRATDTSICSDWSKSVNRSVNSPPPLQTDHSLSRFGQVIRTAVVQLFTEAGLKASMDQLGSRNWQLSSSSPPRPEPENAGLEKYIASLFCYTKRSTNAKQFCDKHLTSSRVKCSWALITRYRARFEPDKFESCRTTNGTRMIPSQHPTSLRTFQRLLRCFVESHVGTFRQACQCSMSTCRWDHVAYLVDKPSIVMLALCGSLRAASNTTGIGIWV